MKHNEIKSYFRKRLQKELNDIGIKCLNVDETNNISRIYFVLCCNNNLKYSIPKHNNECGILFIPPNSLHKVS